MKKVIVGLLALIVSTAIGKAQSSNVLSAWEYVNVYNSEKANGNMVVAIENLLRAKELIDAATLNEKTMNQSKTWKRRAEVYFKILTERDPALAQYKSTVLDEIYTSLLKAQTVEVNEKSGKPYIFEKDDVTDKIYYLSDTLTKSGITYFKSKDFDGALNMFEKRYTLLKGVGIIDTSTYTNMFLAAYKSNNTDRAMSIGNELMGWNYDDPSVYGTMAQIYQAKGEPEKGLQIIKDARKRFPGKTEFITEELNYYLSKSDNVNAVRVLNEAIEAYKGDNEMLKQLYFNSGVIYLNLNDTVKAREYYGKALEIDPNYFSALNNLASSYLTEANALVRYANDLPMNEQAKYTATIAKANEIYKKAADLLEKAYDNKTIELNKTNDAKVKQTLGKEISTLKSILYEIFIKLKNDEKADKYK